MPMLSRDDGRGQIPSDAKTDIATGTATNNDTGNHLTTKQMITQNPIIGKAKKKLGGIYARTLYGKNVLQSCPPPNKAKLAPTQKAAQSAFGFVSKLSTQVSASLLNQIYYTAPVGRNRRQAWCKQLLSGNLKSEGSWQYQPQMIERLGGNSVVSQQYLTLTPLSTSVEIDLNNLNALANAIKTEPPCIILIDVEDCICISLLDYTTIDETTLYLENLSTTLIGKECYLFPLWKINIGTEQNPIITFGSYQKYI